MARHGLRSDHVFAPSEQSFLPPIDEVATVAGGEHVDHHHHHRQGEVSQKDETFGLCELLAVDYRGVNAVSRGVILEEELYPSGRKEQGSDKSAECLTGVTLDEHARGGEGNADEADDERRDVAWRRFKSALHNYHQRVSKRHREGDAEERRDGLGAIIFHLVIMFERFKCAVGAWGHGTLRYTAAA